MVKPGLLAGKTVLRFAHAFESGGGTERYLDDLDRALLERNAMTVVRLHLTRAAPDTGTVPTTELMGQGKLIRVPLPVVPDTDVPAQSAEPSVRSRLKPWVRDWVLYNPVIWSLVGARWTASFRMPALPGQAVGAGRAVVEALRARRVDLVMLHFFGGADADEVVDEVRNARLPFTVLNHYSNDRFLHLAIRKHAMLANGVAGVNGLGVPRYIRDRFTNLSDGIDTWFFRRAEARPLRQVPPLPLILLPARVVWEKGQMDLVRAVASLRDFGIECCVAFAGRVDTSGFVDELRDKIAQTGLTERVLFLGNLTIEELRDWYAASAVMAFPTYHHEGLGRVIIEAQAMGTPVVAYATGGVPEGIADGMTGFLVRTGDVAGLTNRLRELLQSPTLRSTLAANGRIAAEKQFSLAALACRHEQFYAKIMGPGKVVTAPSPDGVGDL